MAIISGGNIMPTDSIGTPYTNAGAPTVNVTQLGSAIVGSLLVDTTNGKLYICTATNSTSTITWTVVGAQT
jgi:hypothetical protein